MSRICREKLCFVEQENYLVIQLFLVTTIEVSSVSLLKDFYDGIDNKKKRKKKQNKCICLLVAHINFFPFLHTRVLSTEASSNMCVCVDIDSNCFSLCMFLLNKSTHHQHHHHQASFVFLIHLFRLIIASSRFFFSFFVLFCVCEGVCVCVYFKENRSLFFLSLTIYPIFIHCLLCDFEIVIDPLFPIETCECIRFA